MPLPGPPAVTKSRKRGREQRWPEAAAGNRRPIALGLAVALLGLQAKGQYTSGGEVSVGCTDCSFCEGSSDDGTVMVFDNPSTGGRVSAVAAREA